MRLESILLGYLARYYQSLDPEVKVDQKRQMFLNWKRLVEEEYSLILKAVGPLDEWDGKRPIKKL